MAGIISTLRMQEYMHNLSPLSASASSNMFSASDLVQRVLALGPEFKLYSAALDETQTVDSVFLHNLTEREIGILFTFIPQAHQMKLESLWSQNLKPSEIVHVDIAKPGLELNSDDDDEFVPGIASLQLPQGGSSEREFGGNNSGDDLFLDLDGSDDEHPLSTAAGKKKKKKKNKKKKKANISSPVEKISQEDLEIIARLDRWLSTGAPLTRKAALRSDFLIRAAQVGHVEAVKVLLGKPGIRVLLELPVGPKRQSTSALHMAAIRGHSDVVRLLLAKPGIQINRQTATPTSYLFDKKTRQTTPLACTALVLASTTGKSEVVKLLLEAGADTEVRSAGFETSLYIASHEGHSEVVKALLDAGADKEAKSGTHLRQTPLHVAAHEGQSEVVKILLDAGADKEVGNAAEKTALVIAAQGGHSKVVRILLDAGANKESRIPGRFTSLFAASQKGHSEVAKMLIDAGADKDAQNTAASITPLTIAAQQGHFELVKVLLNAGAATEVGTSDGSTPLILASSGGHSEVVKVLLDAGADIEARTSHESNPLMVASAGGYSEVVKMLLDAGADTEAQTSSMEESASLILAAQRGHPKVVKMLLDAGTRSPGSEVIKGLLDKARDRAT
jgi:ankyrin repeat protein